MTQQGWQDFGSFVQKAGQSVWLGRGCLTDEPNLPGQLAGALEN